MSAGARALVALAAVAALAAPVSAPATTREYFIAAEEVQWDFAPGAVAIRAGGAHGGPHRGVPKPWAGNTRKRKVRYVEYTDATFSARKPQPEWLGNESDLHSVHWHAKTLRFRGRNTDVIELLPGSMATADMLADDPGTWLLHCHVGDHIDAGMFTTFTVRAP